MADPKPWWQPDTDFLDWLSQPLFPNPATAFAPALDDDEPLFTGNRTGADYAAQPPSAAPGYNFGPVAQASQAISNFGDFLNQPLPNPRAAFAPTATPTPIDYGNLDAAWAQRRQANPTMTANDPVQQAGIALTAPLLAWGDQFMHTPSMVYATATAAQLTAPPPAGTPRNWWGDQFGNFMAVMTLVNGAFDTAFSTPLPGLNLSLAEIGNPAVELQGQSRNVQFAAMEALRTGDSPAATANAATAAALLATTSDRVATDLTGRIQQYSDPNFWGMDPAQAAEFGMARYAATGMNEPNYTNQMLPRRGREGLTAAESYAWQARWVIDRDRDIARIESEADQLAAFAEGHIDVNANPQAQALLQQLGVPTPAEVYQQADAWRALQGRAADFDPNLGYLEFSLATRTALAGSDITPGYITGLSDPVEYDRAYGTPKFLAMVADARRVDAARRALPLNQLQDENINILNQMAYSSLFGLDNLWGAATSAVGLSGKALRFGKALGIISEVGDTTVDAITRTDAATAALRAARPWRFSDEVLQTMATGLGNLKNWGEQLFGIGLGVLGGGSMLLGAGQTENDENRTVMQATGGAFLGLSVMGLSQKGVMAFAGLSGARSSFADFWRKAGDAGEEAYWGEHNALQVPTPQHLTLPRELAEHELSNLSWTTGNNDIAPFLTTLYKRMQNVYNENLTNRYPLLQNAFEDVLRRSDPTQVDPDSKQFINLTQGQRAAYEFSANLIDDLLPNGAIYPDSSEFRLLPGEGVPATLVGKTMAEVNDQIGYNPRRYQGGASDPNTWQYGLTVDLRPDVSNPQAVPGSAAYFLQGADRMDFLTTLMALSETTGVQVKPWVHQSPIDPRNRSAIKNYTTQVELTFSKGGGSANYLDEDFSNNAQNRDALLRMQMTLDLQQRSYDLYGRGGALFGQSTKSPKWADANTDRRIREAIFGAFSGQPDALNELINRAQHGDRYVTMSRIEEAANAYHLNLSRTAAGAQVNVLYTAGADGQRWTNLPETQQTTIVDQLHALAAAAGDDDRATQRAASALEKAFTGDTSSLDYLLGARYSSGASEPRMAAAMEVQSIAASLGLVVNQETVTADRYQLTRPPTPKEITDAAEARMLRRYNLNTGEITTTNAAEPITFDPHAALAPLNASAAALRSQLSQERSADAADYAGMQLLYDIFTNTSAQGVGYDRDAFTYTIPANTPITSDLLLSADRYLEQNAPFHLDWNAITRSDAGTTITVRAGVDQRPATVRSAAFRLDEQMQAAFERNEAGTAPPNTTLKDITNRHLRLLESGRLYPAAKADDTALLDQALLNYGDDLLAAFDAGGSGYFKGGRNQQATAYIGLNEAAASIGFRLQLPTDAEQRPTNQGFAYNLVPLDPNAPLHKFGFETVQEALAYGQPPVLTETLHSFYRHASSGLGALYRGVEEFFNPRRQVVNDPAVPMVYDDGSPYVRPQTELVAEGTVGSYVAKADSPATLERSYERFVDPRQLLYEQTDNDSVYMVLRPGSYAIDEQGNLILMPGPQAQGMRPGPWNPDTGTHEMVHAGTPGATPYGWLAYNTPEQAFAAAYKDVLGTPGDQSLTARQRERVAATRHADYASDPAASMTPEKVASEATDWERGADSERTYTPTGTRQTTPWAGDTASDLQADLGWSIIKPELPTDATIATRRPTVAHTPTRNTWEYQDVVINRFTNYRAVLTGQVVQETIPYAATFSADPNRRVNVPAAAASRPGPAVPYTDTGIADPLSDPRGWYISRMETGLNPYFGRQNPDAQAALQTAIATTPVVRISRSALDALPDYYYVSQPETHVSASTVGGGAVAYTSGANITTINARDEAIRVGLTPMTMDQPITIPANEYSLGVQAGYAPPTPDTLRLDWQPKQQYYGAGAFTFLGNALWDKVNTNARRVGADLRRNLENIYSPYLRGEVYDASYLWSKTAPDAPAAEHVEAAWRPDLLDELYPQLDPVDYEALPYSRVQVRGGRRKLPKNWRIVEQQADQTRIQPLIDARGLSSTDPDVLAARQATAAQRKIYDPNLIADPALTSDPQVENQLPWYVTQPYRDYMARTGQPVAVRPPTSPIDPDANVGAAPYEANYRIYTNENEAFNADELAQTEKEAANPTPGPAQTLDSMINPALTIPRNTQRKLLTMGYTATDIASMTNDDARLAVGGQTSQWTSPRLFSAAAPAAFGLWGANQEDDDGEQNWGLGLAGLAMGVVIAGGNFRQVRNAAGRLFNLKPEDTLSEFGRPLGATINARAAGIIEDVAVVGELDGRPVSRVIYGIGSDSKLHEDYIVGAGAHLQPGYRIQPGETIGEQAFNWRNPSGGLNRVPEAWTGKGFRYGTPGSAASQAEIAQLPDFQQAQAKLAAGQELTPNERLLIQQQRGVQVGQPFSVWDTATIVNVEPIGSELTRVVYGYGYNYGLTDANNANALLHGFQEVTIAGGSNEQILLPGAHIEKGSVIGTLASLPQNLSNEFGSLAPTDLDPYYTGKIATLQSRLDATTDHLDNLREQIHAANAAGNTWRAQNLEHQLASETRTAENYQAAIDELTARQAAIAPAANAAQRVAPLFGNLELGQPGDYTPAAPQDMPLFDNLELNQPGDYTPAPASPNTTRFDNLELSQPDRDQLTNPYYAPVQDEQRTVLQSMGYSDDEINRLSAGAADDIFRDEINRINANADAANEANRIGNRNDQDETIRSPYYAYRHEDPDIPFDVNQFDQPDPLDAENQPYTPAAQTYQPRAPGDDIDAIQNRLDATEVYMDGLYEELHNARAAGNTAYVADLERQLDSAADTAASYQAEIDELTAQQTVVTPATGSTPPAGSGAGAPPPGGPPPATGSTAPAGGGTGAPPPSGPPPATGSTPAPPPSAGMPLWQQMAGYGGVRTPGAALPPGATRPAPPPPPGGPPAATPPGPTLPGMPGRPTGFLASVGAFLNPFAQTLQTRAGNVRDAWDLIGTEITSMTTDPENFITFMRTLGNNPEALNTGIPVEMLPGMEDLADNGMVRLGPGSLGNREIASTMPVIRYGAEYFRAMADRMARDWGRSLSTGDPNPLSPEGFKNYWNRSILQVAERYFGANVKNPLTRTLDELAHWMRKFAAEMKLNFNPGAWINNFLSGNFTGNFEGAQSLAPTAAYQDAMQRAYHLQGPWARAQAGLAGEVTGASTYLGSKGGSIFRATTWTDRLFGEPHTDAGGTYYTGGLFENAPLPVKHYAGEFARRFDAGASSTLGRVADASEKASTQWTGATHVPGTGERVGFGEAAMYYRFAGEARNQFLTANTEQWFAPIFGRMRADAALDPTVVDTIQQYVLANTGTMSSEFIAHNLYRQLANVGIDADPYSSWIGGELLPANLDLHNAALKAARESAGNIMLDTSQQRNIDQWLGWISEFSYFTTHTAANWAVRTLQNPGVLADAANITNAVRRYNAQLAVDEEQERPKRYAESVPLPGGFAMPNPIMQVTGIGKLFINENAASEFAAADTWNEQVLAGFHLFNINLNPAMTALLSGGDWGQVFQQSVPQAKTALDLATTAGLDTGDPYNRFRAARWLGAAMTAGTVDPVTGSYAMNAIFDAQWGTNPGHQYPKEVRATVTSAYQNAGGEMAFTDLTRFLTGIGFKAPMNEDEARAEWLAGTLQQLDAVDGDAAKRARDLFPGLQGLYASKSIYPDQPNGAPTYTPADRLGRNWLPTIPAAPMPAGWQPPAFDTQIGTLITNENNQSKFNMQYSNTALYMLFDPTTGEPFYVGQSVSPSERIVQHIEEANDRDRFAHPKKLHITQLLAAGAVPEMYVFDRLPGSDDTDNDPADVMEQIWIGYFVHERGQTANVDDIPPRAEWERMLTKVGMTVADMDAQFARYATRRDPAQERVQLQRAPNITESQLPAADVPLEALGNKAANWLPTQLVWDWWQQNRSADPSYQAQPGVDWAADQWGLPGVGSAKRDDLWTANITTWEQIANPTPDEYAALLKIAANNESRVAEWMGKAQYTVGVNAGYLPLLPGQQDAEALPPQQGATGPQGFEYYRPAEGAYYPQSSSSATAPLTQTQPISPTVAPGAGEPTVIRTGAGEPTVIRTGAGEPTVIRTGDGEPTVIRTGAYTADPAIYAAFRADASSNADAAPTPTNGYAADPAIYAAFRADASSNADAAPTPTNGYAADPAIYAAFRADASSNADAAAYKAADLARAGYPTTATDPTWTGLAALQRDFPPQAPPIPTREQAFSLLPMLGLGLAGGIAASIGASWLLPAATGAAALAAQPQARLTGPLNPATATPTRQLRPGLPDAPPPIPQVGQYWYFPGYRPSAQPGQQFWNPDLPNGQQFWVPANMVASGEDYRDPDYVNNPQFDPGNPQTSLARMTEFYGPLQPVPYASLAGEGAYIGKGDFTSYDQPRTIRTGYSALNRDPYGEAGAAGMLQTQGAPDPRTQPELYARWQQEIMQPRGEYGIWLDAPIGGTANYGFEQTGTGMVWQTKPRTAVTVSAPGQVVYAGATGDQGYMVVVQHDFGQTVYNNLSGVAVTPGQSLGRGDLVGLSSTSFSLGFQLAGTQGYTDPAPYLPSLGERGLSGWALTDIPGVTAAQARVLVDMGFRTPEELQARGTPAGLDQDPRFGAAFDAADGWAIMGAVNALLQSGPNPNAPLEPGQAALPPSQRSGLAVAGQPAELPTWREGSPAYTNRPPSQQTTGPGSIAPAVSAFAAANQVNPALLQAVLNVEAGGRTHDADTGLAIARFEVHVFRDTSGLDPATFDQHFRVKSWREAEFKDPVTGAWRNVHESQTSEQEAIALAASLTSRDAALYATGQGGAQIMGFHYDDLGYAGAAAMYDAFSADPQAQHQGYFDFLTSSGLLGNLQAGDIEGFVTGYNGPANVPYYSTALRAQQAIIEAGGALQPTAAPATAGAGLDAFTPDMLPGLTELRIAKLVSNTTFRTVGDLSQLDPDQDAQWLGDQMGANDATAKSIILAAKAWTQPGPSTRPATIAYLFATGNRNAVGGDDLSKANLEAIAKAGAPDLQSLAAWNPYDLAPAAGIKYTQARHAVEVARATLAAQGITVEPNSRQTQPGYTAIPAPTGGDPTPLTKDLFPGLTEYRINILKDAGITTVGQLQQVGRPKSGIRNEWVPANTGNRITADTASLLGEAARKWRPITGATLLSEERVSKELNLDPKERYTLEQLGVTTIEQLVTTQARWLDERDRAADYDLPADFTRSEATTLREKAIKLAGLDPDITTDPNRTDPRFEFVYNKQWGGVPGISRERQTWLYQTAPTPDAVGTNEVIDTAAEFMAADPAWLYQAAEQKWAMTDIVAAQNALRLQQGQEPVPVPGSTWLSIAGQDFSRLNLDATKIDYLRQQGITNYPALIARGQNGDAVEQELARNLGYVKADGTPDLDQLHALKTRAAADLEQLRKRQEEQSRAAPTAPTATAATAAPGAPTATAATGAPGFLADPKMQAALQYGAQAAFLGVDPASLAGLTPEEISKKVNDKASTFEQKQMGYGVEDQQLAQFRQRQYQLGEPLARTAQRIQDATDRRTMRQQPEPARQPDIGRLVRSTVAGMEDQLTAKIFKQLQRSLIA